MVGTASPEDVFVLDDVKRKLGISSIRHVLVTSRDIGYVLDQFELAHASAVIVQASRTMLPVTSEWKNS